MMALIGPQLTGGTSCSFVLVSLWGNGVRGGSQGRGRVWGKQLLEMTQSRTSLWPPQPNHLLHPHPPHSTHPHTNKQNHFWKPGRLLKTWFSDCDPVESALHHWCASNRLYDPEKGWRIHTKNCDCLFWIFRSVWLSSNHEGILPLAPNHLGTQWVNCFFFKNTNDYDLFKLHHMNPFSYTVKV